METRLSCKVWQIQFMWLEYILSWVLEIAYISIYLLILSMIAVIIWPLVHLKQVNTKYSDLYNCNTDLKQKCQNRDCNPFHPVSSKKTGNVSVIFTKIKVLKNWNAEAWFWKWDLCLWNWLKNINYRIYDFIKAEVW